MREAPDPAPDRSSIRPHRPNEEALEVLREIIDAAAATRGCLVDSDGLVEVIEGIEDLDLAKELIAALACGLAVTVSDAAVRKAEHRLDRHDFDDESRLFYQRNQFASVFQDIWGSSLRAPQ